MRQITLLAPAKLNLTLDIVGVRADGYHDMQMVMQTIDLCDRLTLIPRTDGNIRCICDAFALPQGMDNLAARAASAFFSAAGVSAGVEIRLHKEIPSGAGMGGGSADAAAVLFGLNRLWGYPLPPAALGKAAESVGADVPFCLHGGTALVEGIGERITPLPDLKDVCFLVVKPPFSIHTGNAFAAFDRCLDIRRPDTQGMLSAIRQGRWQEAGRFLGNVFEPVSAPERIRPVKELLLQAGAQGALMTGSGSAVFGLFYDPGRAQLGKEKMMAKGFDAVWVCAPVSSGPIVADERED